MRLPTPDQLAPEDRPCSPSSIGSAWTRIVSCSSAFPRPTCATHWAKASRGLGRMTKAEFDEFFEAYIALLMKYSHGAEDAPPDARPLYIRLFALPADEE